MRTPTCAAMLAFVERRKHLRDTDGTVILEPWGRKRLALWVDPTRIVISSEAPLHARIHLETFLALYRREKVIGVSVGTLPEENRKEHPDG